MTSDPSIPSVEIPRSALAMLSHRCAGLGTDGVRALRESGYRAGVTIVTSLGDPPGELGVTEFWAKIDRSFTHAGLGSIRFEAVSPAIGALAWRGSAEASGTRSERPGVQCHFAAGVLGGILSRAAERTVDVLEIRCGAGGDQPCWFLFGAVANMRAVHAARLAAARPGPRPDRPASPATGSTT
jgi:hypothetical protein